MHSILQSLSSSDIIVLDEEYKSLSSPLYILLHTPVVLPLLGPNILLSILFSNTFNLCSSLNVSDQVSHSIQTIDKFMVLNLHIFGYQTGRENILHRMTASILWLHSANIVRVIKQEEWDGSGTAEMHTRFWWWNLREREHLKYPGVYGSIILKRIFRKFDGVIDWINLFKPTVYVMRHQFNIQQFCILPTLYLCFLYLSQNEQRILPRTT